MTERIPEVSGSSIVLVGSFNPKIFQPEWFARQNLLSQTEVDEAKIQFIAEQVAQFETERFVVQAITDRIAFVSKPNTNATPLRDLVLGTFFILEHTPVRQLGLNRQMHFAMQSEQMWHALGDKLVPKEGWKGVLPGKPGMLSLSVVGERTQDSEPRITVKVEPSGHAQAKPYGSYFEINEHYDAPDDDGLKTLMDKLRERWEKSQAYASKIANHILDWASS